MWAAAGFLVGSDGKLGFGAFKDITTSSGTQKWVLYCRWQDINCLVLCILLKCFIFSLIKSLTVKNFAIESFRSNFSDVYQMVSELSGCCLLRGFGELIASALCPERVCCPTRGGGCLSARHPSPDRFTVNSVAQVSAHVLSRTRLQPAHKEPKGMWTGRAVSKLLGLMRGFAKCMAGWMHWRGGGGWQWCIMFAEWGKRGQRLAGDAGDWVRHWGQGSWGWAGAKQDLTHQPGSLGICVCVWMQRRKEGVCAERGGAQVEPLAGIPPGISHLLSASWSLVDLVSALADFACSFLLFLASIVESGSFLVQIVHILCHAFFSLWHVCPLPPPAPE